MTPTYKQNITETHKEKQKADNEHNNVKGANNLPVKAVMQSFSVTSKSTATTYLCTSQSHETEEESITFNINENTKQEKNSRTEA